MKSLVDRLEKIVNTDPEMCKFGKTSNLEHLDADIRSGVLALYSSSDPKIRVFATLINAALTQNRLTGLLSQRLLGELLKNDSYQSTKTIDGTRYKEFISFHLRNKVLTLLRKSSEYSSRGARLSAVIKISDEEIAALVISQADGAYYEEQERKVLYLYDAKFKAPEPVIHSSHDIGTDVVSENEPVSADLANSQSLNYINTNGNNNSVEGSDAFEIGDDFKTALAMNSSRQVVILETLHKLHSDGIIRLTNFELDFVNTCSSALTRHMNCLTPKRYEKLQEIAIKYAGVYRSHLVDIESNRLLQVCSERIGASDQEVADAFTNLYGHKKLELALEHSPLASHRAVAAIKAQSSKHHLNSAHPSKVSDSERSSKHTFKGISNYGSEDKAWDAVDSLHKRIRYSTQVPAGMKDELERLYSLIAIPPSHSTRAEIIEAYLLETSKLDLAESSSPFGER